MFKLRDVPLLGNVYAVVTALGLVALIVGAIGVDAGRTDEHSDEAQRCDHGIDVSQ